MSARKLATKTDITNEIKNLSRDRSHLKQLRKKTAEEVAQRAKMKLCSDTMRRIKLQKLETEGFGFVIKGDKPVFISELKGGGAAQKAGIQARVFNHSIKTWISSWNHRVHHCGISKFKPY